MSRAGVTATIRARSPEHFGPALRKVRLARGLTQEQVAEHLGCSAPDVGRYERCTQHGPKREAIVRLTRSAGLSLKESMELLAAAAADRGDVDVSDLSLDETYEIVSHAEALRATKRGGSRG